MLSQNFYRKNRKKLFNELENNTLALIYSGKDVPQISDLETFYPDNNFYYLTGLNEADQSLVLYKDDEGNCYEHLFIPESNPQDEKWVGAKISIEEASNKTGIQNISYTSSKEDYLEDLVTTQDPVIGIDKSQPVHRRNLTDYTYFEESKLLNLAPIFDKLRLIKEDEEIDRIKEAALLSGQGLNEILKTLKPDLNERELAALFEYVIKKNGADSLSFPTIAASGENATVLHYTQNNKDIKENELILFDLGSRFDGYCSDISRTFPVDGSFTPIQKKFYKVVLDTQKELIKHYKKGINLSEIQKLTKELFIKNLQEQGIKIPEGGIDEWYYHNIGHSLGLQTHDSENRNFTLEDGMVITCEPGLYAKEYNIGIRIEDDILVNGDEPIVLTAGIPKEIDEIIEIMNNKTG